MNEDLREKLNALDKETLVEMLIGYIKFSEKIVPTVTSTGLEYEIKEHTVNYTQGFNGLKVLPEPE